MRQLRCSGLLVALLIDPMSSFQFLSTGAASNFVLILSSCFPASPSPIPFVSHLLLLHVSGLVFFSLFLQFRISQSLWPPLCREWIESPRKRAERTRQPSYP